MTLSLGESVGESKEEPTSLASRESEIAELQARARRMVDAQECICPCGYPILRGWAEGNIENPDQVREVLAYQERIAGLARENLKNQGIEIGDRTLFGAYGGSVDEI
ncbi:MAG: hypothetical protein ABH856_04500 [Patescibacteria group bacterium]|nr:hypothetical protein [Patescibacteria group bacterium]